MSSSKKFTCKGTLGCGSAGVYRVLKTGDSQFLSLSCLYFQPSFVICTLPCYPSPLLYGSTLPPFPVWISILYTCEQCVRGGAVILSSGPQTDKHLSFTGILDDDIFHCLLLIFLRLKVSFSWLCRMVSSLNASFFNLRNIMANRTKRQKSLADKC